MMTYITVHSQETEADPVEDKTDTTKSSDERSGSWNPPGWNPHGWNPHSSLAYQLPVLQLSTDTLRQCSAQGGGDDGGDRCNSGGSNKPVLRAVGCTQAVLRDGQFALLSRLEHLQTALWHKVETLKQAIEGRPNAWDKEESSWNWDKDESSWKQDTLEDIKKAVEGLVRWKRREDDFLKKFRYDVLDDLRTLKRSQYYILYKLYWIKKDVVRLSKKVRRCCGKGSDVPQNGHTQCSSSEIVVGDRCQSCPRGYEGRDERCYRFASSMKSFAEAKAACENDGAFLATMTPDNEDIIFGFAERSEGEESWAGLYKDRANKWKWHDGTRANELAEVSFFSSKPLNKFANDCAAVSRKNEEDSFVDRSCAQEKSFVCEFKPLGIDG